MRGASDVANGEIVGTVAGVLELKTSSEDWDQVKTCSDRCGGELRLKGPATNKGLTLRSVQAPSDQGRCGHAH